MTIEILKRQKEPTTRIQPAQTAFLRGSCPEYSIVLLHRRCGDLLPFGPMLDPPRDEVSVRRIGQASQGLW